MKLEPTNLPETQEQPKSPEYLAFEDGMKKILKVPKAEIERLEAEERERKKRSP